MLRRTKTVLGSKFEADITQQAHERTSHPRTFSDLMTPSFTNTLFVVPLNCNCKWHTSRRSYHRGGGVTASQLEGDLQRVGEPVSSQTQITHRVTVFSRQPAKLKCKTSLNSFAKTCVQNTTSSHADSNWTAHKQCEVYTNGGSANVLASQGLC